MSDGEDTSAMAGALTLFVAFLLTLAVIGRGASIEFVILTGMIWVLGTAIKLTEVTHE